ncbi:uncharacterized protein LOC143225112 isoform X2 [Tachypleus tridentatus]|uniref:uncharacterized protein LOC143225112 isoform X2 n=1 Tax=Tachypleus tridentatus TaxID=6853 RepID=UPI003FD55298
MSSADILQRQRQRERIEEEKTKTKMTKEIQKRQREEEKRRDMEMLISYNPWNKSGAGAPKEDVKRKKNIEPQLTSNIEEDDDALGNTLFGFGRPGAGAPHRTMSGRVKTQISGDPDIRFQDAQHVRLSIDNQLRYKNSDNEKTNEMRRQDELTRKERLKQMQDMEYQPWGKGFGNPDRDSRGNVRRHKFSKEPQQGALEPQPLTEDLGTALPLSNRGGNGAPQLTASGNLKTRLKKTLDSSTVLDQINGANAAPSFEEEENYYPWGKSGAGAPLKEKNKAGRDFMEKMGWSTPSSSKRKSQESKQNYLNTLLKEAEDKKARDNMEKQYLSDSGLDLVSVMREKTVGHPKRDEITGELLNQPKGVSDVTATKLDIRRAKSDESVDYHNYLSQQAEDRQRQRYQQKEQEIIESQKHLDTWNAFWGKAGNGAPVNPNNHRKPNNINSLLNNSEGGMGEPYVKRYTQVVAPSKHRNRYDTESDPSKVFTKDYEFRTPWAATMT